MTAIKLPSMSKQNGTDRANVNIECGTAYQKISILRNQGYSEAFYSMQDAAHKRAFQQAVEELVFHRLDHHAVQVEGAAILFISKETADFLGIPARRAAARQVLDGEEDEKES